MPYQSIYRADLFKGQTIIVTGGGSGIGRCTAHELSSLGAHVALVGRRLDKLQAVQAEITEDGGSASSHVADIREEAQVIAVVDAVLAQRHGTESEIASAIVYLLSPAAACITGSCLRVDGGTPNNRPSYWKLQPSDRSEPFNGFHRSELPDLLKHGLPGAST